MKRDDDNAAIRLATVLGSTKTIDAICVRAAAGQDLRDMCHDWDIDFNSVLLWLVRSDRNYELFNRARSFCFSKHVRLSDDELAASRDVNPT